MRHIVLTILLSSLATGPVIAAADYEQSAPTASVTAKTGKERLTDKGSDEQRVDDCKVPPAQRTRARPTSCHF
ncbi:MAG TPA: hypothetical protein VKI44_18295 [Acetobacteraceae bacterium]|nr:hypothetical protein [Acetobacteraceae bacterium]